MLHSYDGQRGLFRCRRERRSVTDIVASVTRWRRRLDFAIQQLISQDIESLDPPMRQLLRVALYEIIELGLAPHAINEHVELAKRIMRPEAGRFANGEP